jgi:Tetratricopeptide repeat
MTRKTMIPEELLREAEDKYKLICKLFSDGKYNDAYLAIHQLFDWSRNNLPPDDPYPIQVADKLARFLSDQGYADEAAMIRGTALETREKIQGADHPESLKARLALSKEFYGLGWYVEAFDLLSRNVELFGKGGNSTKGDVALESRDDLVSTLLKLHRYDEAVEAGRQALALREEVLRQNTEADQKDHKLAKITSARHNLARGLHKLGTLESLREAEAINLDNVEAWNKLGMGEKKRAKETKGALVANRLAIAKLLEGQKLQEEPAQGNGGEQKSIDEKELKEGHVQAEEVPQNEVPEETQKRGPVNEQKGGHKPDQGEEEHTEGVKQVTEDVLLEELPGFKQATQGVPPEEPPRFKQATQSVPPEEPPGFQQATQDVPPEEPPGLKQVTEDVPPEEPPGFKQATEDVPPEESPGLKKATEDVPSEESPGLKQATEDVPPKESPGLKQATQDIPPEELPGFGLSKSIHIVGGGIGGSLGCDAGGEDARGDAMDGWGNTGGDVGGDAGGGAGDVWGDIGGDAGRDAEGDAGGDAGRDAEGDAGGDAREDEIFSMERPQPANLSIQAISNLNEQKTLEIPGGLDEICSSTKGLVVADESVGEGQSQESVTVPEKPSETTTFNPLQKDGFPETDKFLLQPNNGMEKGCETEKSTLLNDLQAKNAEITSSEGKDTSLIPNPERKRLSLHQGHSDLDIPSGEYLVIFPP